MSRARAPVAQATESNVPIAGLLLVNEWERMLPRRSQSRRERTVNSIANCPYRTPSPFGRGLMRGTPIAIATQPAARHGAVVTRDSASESKRFAPTGTIDRLEPYMPFMLCDRLTDPARVHDRRYTAEPKLDGQRAQ